MSRSLRSLGASLRISTSIPSTVGVGTIRVRRYVQAALKTRPEQHPKSAPQRIPQRPKRKTISPGEDDDFDSRVTAHGNGDLDSEKTLHTDGTHETHEHDVKRPSPPREKYKHPEPHFAEHLNGLFPTLHFPPELARRIVTHGSHPAATRGHNAAYSFMGRRILEAYLLLLLNSSPALHPKHDLDDIVTRTLNSYTLGEYVGSAWGLGRMMRWTPTIPADKLKPGEDNRELLKSVGLYKVQGDAVSAVMGGIFYQFGGSVSHRVFHTRLLPNLLTRTPDGLPEIFHADAREACERMGGENGQLLLDTSTPVIQAQTAS
ncbi:hypothetical protein L208DRAFT_1402143 [Tricholoma matsutake]|nr:hypothetical protein L208DRAFT_1402143 [Tricholoma matsutake 945]